MNRDEIWQQLKDDKETVYGKKMLEVFLAVTETLNIDHLEEALDSGYEVSEEFLIRTIATKASWEESWPIDTNDRSLFSVDMYRLLTVVLKKKNISSELMYTILRACSTIDEMKKIAEKINLDKMTLDYISRIAHIKIEDIEKIYEIFGNRMRNFDTKQVLNLLKRSISYKNMDKVVNVLGGWKSVVEKMKEGVKAKPTNDYNFRDWQLVPLHDYHELRSKLRELRKHFAEKIIENDKSANAMKLAKFFYPEKIESNIGKT